MTAERSRRLQEVLDKRQNDLTVVLENVEDPHNISAVMRSCDAVGIQDIYIINTKSTLQHKFGHRSSRSAEKWLSLHSFTSVAGCFAVLRKNYSRILCTYLTNEACPVFELDFVSQPLALVFGNERTGVSDEVLRLSDGNFNIPQSGFIKSLNISVACAVTIFEAFRQKQLAGHYERNNFPAGRREELMQKWDAMDLAKKRDRIIR